MLPMSRFTVACSLFAGQCVGLNEDFTQVILFSTTYVWPDFDNKSANQCGIAEPSLPHTGNLPLPNSLLTISQVLLFIISTFEANVGHYDPRIVYRMTMHGNLKGAFTSLMSVQVVFLELYTHLDELCNR